MANAFYFKARKSRLKRVLCIIFINALCLSSISKGEYTVKSRSTVFVRGVLKKNYGYGKMIDARAYSLNRLCSWTTELEQWIWENDTSGNDRLRFHCI
jgi:hypothetical protein